MCYYFPSATSSRIKMQGRQRAGHSVSAAQATSLRVSGLLASKTQMFEGSISADQRIVAEKAVLPREATINTTSSDLQPPQRWASAKEHLTLAALWQYPHAHTRAVYPKLFAYKACVCYRCFPNFLLSCCYNVIIQLSQENKRYHLDGRLIITSSWDTARETVCLLGVGQHLYFPFLSFGFIF